MIELQIEWGLSDQEFDQIPYSKIQKVLEYRRAKAIGTYRHELSQNK